MVLLTFYPAKMNTNYLFRRVLIIDPSIRKFINPSRFLCSKRDGIGETDESVTVGNKSKSESNISDKKSDHARFLTDDVKEGEFEGSQPFPKVKKSKFVEAFEKFSIMDSDQENELRNKEKETLDSPFTTATDAKLGGFAKAFEKFSKFEESVEQESDSDSDSEKEQQTFASLLRNSKFIDLGDPEGKIVLGSIYHIVGNDLYIDFGWKFPTVCQRPPQGGENFVRGAKVRLLIKDLELSTRFLGSTTDITLREADCVLLGLAKSRSRNV